MSFLELNPKVCEMKGMYRGFYLTSQWDRYGETFVEPISITSPPEKIGSSSMVGLQEVAVLAFLGFLSTATEKRSVTAVHIWKVPKDLTYRNSELSIGNLSLCTGLINKSW